MDARESQIWTNIWKQELAGIVTPTLRAQHTRFCTQIFEVLGFDVQSVRNMKQTLC
jgi:hypothetical protein